MEAFIAIEVGVLVAAGVYLLLRARTFSVILGLVLVGYGVNMLLFFSGGITFRSAPLLDQGFTYFPDPLPQALVLTAIVIGLAMTAFVLVLALRAFAELGTDHVDGEEGR